MWFPNIAIDFVFVLEMVILYFLAIRFKWYAIVCNSSSHVAIKIWSSAYSIVFNVKGENFLRITQFVHVSNFIKGLMMAAT